jgi:hypothetical protein
MRATRKIRTLLLLAGALVLLTERASAQMGGGRGPPRPGDNQSESPVDQQRRKQIDNDYQAATKIVPDQKPKDPWADVRSAPTAPAPKRNPQ